MVNAPMVNVQVAIVAGDATDVVTVTGAVVVAVAVAA